VTYSQKAIIKLKNYIKGEFMASVIGVVKSISDKNAKVINNLTKEERALNVGDILFQNDTIISDDANFKVEVAKVGGSDKVFTGKRVDLTNFADDGSSAQSSGNDEIASLQQAIFKGENLINLEETAAGGNQAGGNASGGGVSLGAASFAQGGHYSNINANFQNLSDILRGDVPSLSSVSGYADAGVALVHFSRGVRTARHTHPAGQNLIVTLGKIYTSTADGIMQIYEMLAQIGYIDANATTNKDSAKKTK
jgi:putative S-layer-RTX protein